MGDGGHPSLRALVTARRGGANLREVALRLPLALALDYENAGALCSSTPAAATAARAAR